MQKQYSTSPKDVFLAGLSPVCSETPLRVNEVLENYQHIFSSNGSGHLDQVISRSFPFLRIYRGLPRLYHRTSPIQSYIKKQFSHLPSLRQKIIAQPLFATYADKKVEGTVSLLCWSLDERPEDGRTALLALKILQERFPQLVLHLVMPDELKMLEKSDLIVQMPIFYPETRSLLKKIPKTRMELLGGCGLIESGWFHPRTSGYSLGLHYLEKGVLLPEVRHCTWDDVQNEEVRSWRNPNNSFYLAQLSTREGAHFYLNALMRLLEGESKQIDLLTNNAELFGPLPPKIRLFSSQSISHEDLSTLTFLSGDLVGVRGDASFSDAIAHSKPFFYDGTIDARYFWKDLLALAENRIRNYSDSLQALRLNYKAFVAHLPQQDGEWVDETFFQSEEAGEDLSELVSEAFKTPQALAGYKALARIIQEEFSANDFLCHLVQRGLTLSKDPVFLWEEEKRMQAFAHGVIDIDQLCMR